ncbi:MAG: proton-conducting transporter membrane subunit [Candidatus Margulisiibacteriota bacterium]
MGNYLLLPILIPIVSALVIFILPENIKKLKESITILIAFVNLALAFWFFGHEFSFTFPWCGLGPELPIGYFSTVRLMWFSFGIDFSLRLYQFSAFILAAIASFAFLIAVYSTVFMKERPSLKQYYIYFLLTIGLSNGVALSNNLFLFLIFWEALLLPLFGMIFVGGKDAYKAAIKAFIIIGITDLCLMLGVILTGYLAGTFTLSQISLPLTGLGSVAFILLMIGAIAKAGSMPFHSWIPDAAVSAPLPFMAILPASIEKLLGIYFLARISLDLFKLSPNSWLSPLLMWIGVITIILAVMMALIQKDFKRLLSYHAISQVGYMILGIGTAVPVGIVGGLFHMINHATYKSCLFLTGGSVEKQTGTTDLSKLGGLAWKMPITFICFMVAAASISGVPPFNGFFSKELVYDGALERGWIFYALALLGSFLTAASFLKLGHAAFFGEESKDQKEVKEASLYMLLPMVVLALVCIFFGVWNIVPLKYLIQPILGQHLLEGHTFYGMPSNMLLIVMTGVVLIAAILNHIYGVSRTGKGVSASDHIHYAPVLSTLYDKAEKRWFDPYDIGMKLAHWFSYVLWGIDRLVDWIFEVFIVRIAYFLSWIIRLVHSGNFSAYIAWSLVGAAAVVVFLLR